MRFSVYRAIIYCCVLVHFLIVKHCCWILTRVQESFGWCSQKYGLNYGWSCLEPGVGVYDLCGPLPTQDTLQFYDLLVFYVVPGSVQQGEV